MFDDIFGDLFNDSPSVKQNDQGPNLDDNLNMPDELWSTKSELWNNEDSSKLWEV